MKLIIQILLVTMIFYSLGCTKGFRKKPADSPAAVSTPTGYEYGEYKYGYEYVDGKKVWKKIKTPGKTTKLKQFRFSHSMFGFANGSKRSGACRDGDYHQAVDALADVTESLCLAEADSNSIWFGTKYAIDTAALDKDVPNISIWVDDRVEGEVAIHICRDNQLATVVNIHKFDRKAGILSGTFTGYADRYISNASFTINDRRGHIQGDLSEHEQIDLFFTGSQENRIVFSKNSVTAIEGARETGKKLPSQWDCQTEKTLKFAATQKNLNYLNYCQLHTAKLRNSLGHCTM